MSQQRRAADIFSAMSRYPTAQNGFRMPGLSSMISRVTAYQSAITKMPEPVQRLHAIAQRATRRQQMFEAAGWLPHYTTPFDDMDALTDDDAAGDLLDAHYRENWVDVRREFEAQLAGYTIDEEARAVFLEALSCHEVGAYRAVSRLLFPDIERLATAVFPKRRAREGGPVGALREFAAGLYLDQTNPGGVEGYELFRRLDEHLYAQVHTDEEVERARLDPVPMRHATLHGKAPYSTFRNSLNAVIMADYVLQVISIRNLEIATKTDEDPGER